jgi:uncharacterized protein (DUF885 family)
MRRFFFILFSILLLNGCQTASIQNPQSTNSPNNEKIKLQLSSESSRLNEWFDTKYEELLQMQPTYMTFYGRKDKSDQVEEYTESEKYRLLKWREKTVVELKSKFDYDKLDKETKTSYDLWLYQYEEAVEAFKFVRSNYVFTQMMGEQSQIPQFLINYHKVDNEADMEAYIKRIVAFSKTIDELLDRAKLHASEGVRPPKFSYEGVIEESEKIITGLPFTQGEKDSALWADVKSKVSALVEKKLIDESKASELKVKAKQALLTHWQPAYKNLISWFKSDIDNTDKIAQGVGSLPDGKAFYNYKLKENTTTSLTADEVHQIGLNEVNRLTKEMEEIKSKVKFTGSLNEFFSYLKEDDQFYYPNNDEGRLGYITDTAKFYASIKKQLPVFFGILPKADIEVKRVEAFREQDGGVGHYYPGTADGSRPGVYYAHLINMRSVPKKDMESLAYHEGIPGHHMQISIAQEITSLPKFRTHANFTAYGEGWGLYAEFLAKEMGGYETHYSNFGRLSFEIWRAARLVVDTGLHAKGWTEEDAISYFQKVTPLPDKVIKSEIRRYLVWPGQATAYKIGMLKIMELRSKAKRELKDKFNIADFHDVVLGGGGMPLSILKRRVKNWIDEQLSIS